VCLGGGITGLYFEIGALKCLEDCCSTGTLNACDLYFGISAGSVVTGMLANGFTVGEIMAGIAGVEGGRIPPFDLTSSMPPISMSAGSPPPSARSSRSRARACRS